MRVLDLFSGIGGFALGFHMASPVFQTAAFVEKDPYCRQVLAQHWPETPIYDDIRTFDATGLADIDIITGGPPCQPWSNAGEQRGAEDDRDLWPQMLGIIDTVKPRWVVGENVRGFISQPMGLDRSLSDLEDIGYSSQSFSIPAIGADARHLRHRCWIIGCSTDTGQPRLSVPKQDQLSRAAQQYQGRTATQPRWWPAEPDVGRVAHGVPNRVDRLRSLGNAIVPQVAMHIARAILTAEAQ